MQELCRDWGYTTRSVIKTCHTGAYVRNIIRSITLLDTVQQAKGSY